MTSATRLPASLKIFHGLGAVAYGIKDNGFSVFLLIFYNQVMGLDAGLVGTVIMAALIFDALADPVIGELSDRTQSRWGRRLPWLYSAAIPVGLAWMLLWHPPALDETGLLLWLFATAILARFLIAMCEIPSIALVPEITSDYDERTVLMRYRLLCAWGGGLLILILAYGLFFTDAKGVGDPDGYDAFSLCGALIMTGSVLFSALAQHRYVARQSPAARPAHSLRQALFEMRETLSNRAFVILACAALFGLINQGMTFALSNYLLSYIWQLERMEFLYYGVILFASVIIAFFIVPSVSHKMGKKNGAIMLAILTLSINTALYCCWLFDMVPGGTANPQPLFMFGFVILANSAAVGMMILTNSMFADVVEASEAETGRRSEGLFFAGYFFTQKCAVGIGTFFAGMILTFSAFPEKAVAGQIDIAILNNFALFYMLSLLTIGIIGISILRHFPISRESHNERLRVLNTAAESAS
ncbi:MFS transporter [Sphingorhabdus sp.]|uniref:MFS transporter n=1 Tax=Sphingorhabdus sp. TaxID=1902408 RepID=UPI0035941A37